ncbi:dicarboxylate/amino acid:cation symporter [Leptospira ognonensis]|uniref:Dicarboxylate/amino acid:cation symporter n=1 Tax=Leptospira ognonensis TaxID=2484945 RepID=A0A4R9K906_9LEPT|nr:dicarboxylate/amino acid:cation symporter [Leptospira ognonensis]TGL63128.1 dicarboxylate/amino acid:cation symporter [Leptospira ognonensis]
MTLKSIPFWLMIVTAFIAGTVIGVCLHPETNLIPSHVSLEIIPWLKLPGDLFLNLLQMIMIPLVIASVALGVSSLSSLSELVNLGSKTMFYFLFTTMIAIIIGISIATLLEPGKKIDLNRSKIVSTTPQLQNTTEESIPQTIANLVPKNIFRYIAEQRMLSLVLLGVLLGIFFLSSANVTSDPLKLFLKSIEAFSIWIVTIAMKLAPVAVFGLMAFAITQIGISLISGLFYYVLSVLLGLFILLLFYLIIVLLIAKRNPINFLKNIREVQILGFSTSSSSSVLPISLKLAKDKLKIREKVADFVLPLGATINMDGTALYQAVATIFLSQVYQIEFTFFQLILLVITVTGASIGTAATPGVGIVILGSILHSFNIPVEGIAIIFGVDRFLDMCRTSVNLSGDLVTAAVMDKWTE